MIRRMTGMALLVLMMVWCVPASAGVKTEERGDKVNATSAKDWMPHPSKHDYYTESWTTVIRSDSGHVLYLTLMTTNIGVFKGQAAVSVSHSEPGKKSQHYKWEYKPEQFSANAGTGTIKVGPNSISLKGRDARLIIKEKEFSMDVTLKGWTDGTQLYYARTDIDRKEGEWTATWFHMPRGDVTGSLTYGGKKASMDGDGYIDHMVQNVLGGDYSTRWWALRHFGKDYTIVAIAFKARKEAGGGTWLRVLVADHTKVQLMTDKGSLSGSKMASDPEGYKYHTVFSLKSEEGGVKAEGTFSSKRFHDRVSVMEELPWAQRQVAKMVAGNPIAYRMEGTGSAMVTLPGAAAVKVDGPVLLETFVMEEGK